MDDDTTNKPIATIGNRIAVAVLSLLGSAFLVFGFALPAKTFDLFGPLFIIDQISITPSTAGNIILVGRLLYLFLLPVFGFLGDKFGRIRLIIIGLILSGLSVTFMGFVSTSILFRIAVFCLQIGTAMTISCILSLMLEGVTTHWLLSFAAIIYLSGIHVADIVSTILGGQFSSQNSMPQLFMITGAITAGCILSGGILVFLAQTIKKRFQWADEWLDHSQYQHQNVTLILLFAIVFLVFISINISTNLYPYYLLKLISTNEMALLMSSFSISFFLGFSSIGILSDVANWLSTKFINKNIGRIGVLISGLLISLIGYNLPLINNIQLNMALSFRAIVTGVGFGVSLPPLIALIAEQVSHYRWGLTISWYFTVCAIGAFAAPFITTYLIETSGYSPQLSTQPTSVHVIIASTIPWLLLTSIFIALIIAIIVLVINLKPLQSISAIETN